MVNLANFRVGMVSIAPLITSRCSARAIARERGPHIAGCLGAVRRIFPFIILVGCEAIDKDEKSENILRQLIKMYVHYDDPWELGTSRQ